MKKKIVVALVMLAVVIVGRTISYALEVSKTNNDVVEIVEDTVIATNDSYIGEDAASTVAFEHAGVEESAVTNLVVTFDFDDGVAEYEVDFNVDTTEYDYEINALTGAVIGYDKDVEKTQSTTSSSTSTSYIGETKAKAAAFTHANINESDASNVVVTFDFDDGVAEYEVDFNVDTTEYDYEINALTGAIYEFSVERD